MVFFFLFSLSLEDKCLKEKILRLVDSGLFDRIPEPEKDTKKNEEQTPDALSTSGMLPGELPEGNIGRVACERVDVTYWVIWCFPLQQGSV